MDPIVFAWVLAGVLGGAFGSWIYFSKVGESATSEPEMRNGGPVVQEMCEAFATGRIVRQSISRLNISTLSVEWRDTTVTVSWFPERLDGDLHTIKMGDVTFPYATRDANYILRVAKRRARGLLAETLSKLEKK